MDKGIITFFFGCLWAFSLEFLGVYFLFRPGNIGTAILCILGGLAVTGIFPGILPGPIIYVYSRQRRLEFILFAIAVSVIGIIALKSSISIDRSNSFKHKPGALLYWQYAAAQVPKGTKPEAVREYLSQLFKDFICFKKQGEKEWYCVSDSICIGAIYSGAHGTLGEALTVEKLKIPKTTSNNGNVIASGHLPESINENLGENEHESFGVSKATIFMNRNLHLKAIGAKWPETKLIGWTNSGKIICLNEKLEQIKEGEPFREPDNLEPFTRKFEENVYAKLDENPLPPKVVSLNEWEKLLWERPLIGGIFEDKKDGRALIVESTVRDKFYLKFQIIIPCPYDSSSGTVVVSSSGRWAASVHKGKIIFWSLPSCRAVSEYDFGTEINNLQLSATLGGNNPRVVGLIDQNPFVCTADWSKINSTLNTALKDAYGKKEIFEPILKLSDFDAYTKKEAEAISIVSRNGGNIFPIVRNLLRCKEYDARVVLVNLLPECAGEETVPLLVELLKDPSVFVVYRSLTTLIEIAGVRNISAYKPIIKTECEILIKKHWDKTIRELAVTCINKLEENNKVVKTQK
jgi:hypothetical protein